jgi:hypothetical protein
MNIATTLIGIGLGAVLFYIVVRHVTGFFLMYRIADGSLTVKYLGVVSVARVPLRELRSIDVLPWWRLPGLVLEMLSGRFWVCRGFVPVVCLRGDSSLARLVVTPDSVEAFIAGISTELGREIPVRRLDL